MALTRVSGGILKQPIDVGIITATSLNASGIVTAGTVQVGSATTIHTTGIDLGSGNVTSHNINSTGIITATSFVGPVTGNLTGNVTGNLTGNVTGNITATTGSFSGDVSIGGTLTYEDVTNIDAVGIITAQSGIHVTSGSVGIKTTAPNNTLTVGDGVQTSYAPSTAGNYLEIARTSGADAGLLINKNTGQWLVGIDNSDGANAPLRFEYGAAGSAHPGFGAGALGMIIKHDGKIGIGEDSPATILHVKANVGDLLRLDRNNTGAVGNQIAFRHSNSGTLTETGSINCVSTANAATGELRFYTKASGASNAEKLRITSDGKVGINQSNPSTKLEVGGGSILVDAYNTSGDHGIFFRRGFNPNSNSYNLSILAYDHNGNGSTKDGLSINGYDGISFCTGSNTRAEKLRITSAGNVGINDTAPSQKLNVGGNIMLEGGDQFMYLTNVGTGNAGIYVRGRNSTSELRSHSTGIFTWEVTGSEKMRLTSDGLLGIGHNSPTAYGRMTVAMPSQSAGAAIQVANSSLGSGDGTTSNIVLRSVNSNGTQWADAEYRASQHIFAIQGTEKLRITSSGAFMINGNSLNYLKNEYRGTVSVTGTNNELFAFEIQGAANASGGLLFVYGTSSNVVVNVSAEILVNHYGDVTIKSMSGAYTQARIRVKTDNNARAAIYLGRSGGYASGSTGLNWKFIPYGGTYAYTTESTNNGTDHTHTTQSGSFRITAAGGGAGNVNASGSKNFMIDHPLESLRETTRLAHAAVEGPECNTIYRGKVDLVDGTATVNIDTNSRMTEGTFVALNQNVQCFTTNETGWTAIKGSVSGNLLTITAQDNTCTDTISWMVVGERHDKDIIDNRSTDSEGRFIPEVTDEYDPSQFAEYTDPVEPEQEP